MGRFCFFADTGLTGFRRTRGFFCNFASLLKLIRSEKTTCWFWKIFCMMKNRSNFPIKNLGSAINNWTKK